jgi:hypothetical protein
MDERHCSPDNSLKEPAVNHKGMTVLRGRGSLEKRIPFLTKRECHARNERCFLPIYRLRVLPTSNHCASGNTGLVSKIIVGIHGAYVKRLQQRKLLVQAVMSLLRFAPKISKVP